MDARKPRNSKPPPWDESGSGQTAAFGAWLRQHREIRGISLRDIADTTKIGIRYLEALEEDRFDVLPAAVFVKGFLREYARFVGLDDDEVVNTYLGSRERAVADSEEVEGESNAPAPPSSTPMVFLVTFGLVAVMVGAFYLAFRVSRARVERAVQPPEIALESQRPADSLPQPEEPTEVSLIESPEPGERAPEPEQQQDPLRVTLDFDQDCWVEALVDGRSRTSELRVQGESLSFGAQKSVRLTLGNAQGVRIEVNGMPYQPRTRSRKVVRDIQIDLSTLEALQEPIS